MPKNKHKAKDTQNVSQQSHSDFTKVQVKIEPGVSQNDSTKSPSSNSTQKGQRYPKQNSTISWGWYLFSFLKIWGSIIIFTGIGFYLSFYFLETARFDLKFLVFLDGKYQLNFNKLLPWNPIIINNIPIVFIGFMYLLTLVSRFPITQLMINKGYDNDNPRRQQASFDANSFASRCVAAHQNQIESFLYFSAVVLAGVVNNLNRYLLTKFCFVFFVLRLFYLFFYYINWSSLRSIVWFLGNSLLIYVLFRSSINNPLLK